MLHTINIYDISHAYVYTHTCIQRTHTHTHTHHTHTHTHTHTYTHTRQPYVPRPRPILRMRIIQPPKKILKSQQPSPQIHGISIICDFFFNFCLRAMPSHVTVSGCLPALMVNVPGRSPVSSSSSSSSCRTSSSEGPIRNARKSVP